ncbi:virulence RhuM family protein [Xanthomonas hortorum pv. pelargonii]|nr:virulence RhuM family protein [Xanthomonas hortorum pv. pelargonii]
MTTAAHGQKTAAHLVVEPAKPSKPHIALTGGKASRVRKNDLIFARNALDPEKVAQLNRVPSMFLNYAEDRASQRRDLRMDDWRQHVDRFVEFNERPLLKDAGTVSHERMQQIVHERYAAFDAKRRLAEPLPADVEDIRALELVEKSARREGLHAKTKGHEMLPKDWLQISAGECTELLTGHAFNSQHYAEPNASTVRLLRGDNVVPGSLRWDDAKHWATPYAKQLQRYEMRQGDIVIAMDRPLVGAGLKCSVVKQHDLPCLLVQRVARLRAKSHVEQGYLTQLFQTRQFSQHLKGQKTETAVPHISPNDIRDFQLALPSNLHEQRRIAHILSTWDQAIATTERLLANSRHQKMLLSQQVLTGKARLAGFTASGHKRNTPYGSVPVEWDYPESAMSLQKSAKN